MNIVIALEGKLSEMSETLELTVSIPAVVIQLRGIDAKLRRGCVGQDTATASGSTSGLEVNGSMSKKDERPFIC